MSTIDFGNDGYFVRIPVVSVWRLGLKEKTIILPVGRRIILEQKESISANSLLRASRILRLIWHCHVNQKNEKKSGWGKKRQNFYFTLFSVCDS